MGFSFKSIKGRLILVLASLSLLIIIVGIVSLYGINKISRPVIEDIPSAMQEMDAISINDETLLASTEILDSVRSETQVLVRNQQVVISLLIILFILLSLGLGIQLYQSISLPLGKLQKATSDLEKGDFKTRVDIKTGNEFQEIGSSFNKAIEALEKIDEEHKQIDKAKTEFMSITSHELRSPMTPMKAQLQMLMGDYFGKLNDKQKESVNIVLRNTERLDGIILDFLEVSRIEAARLKFKFIKNTNLIEHVTRLAEEMKGFMPEKNISVELELGKIPKIEVDPDRVMQVLRNLINNAKKFTKKDGKIVVSTQLNRNMILISVEDNGIGISSESAIRIFEPFFQAEQTMYRKHQGTGLGLAICKGIVESQEGKIWLESEEGKGTTFYFTVPLKPVREIKSIKLLFSPKIGVGKKVGELIITILGPMGQVELDQMKQQGLTYERIVERLNELHRIGIITEEVVMSADSNLKAIFEIKAKGKKVDIPTEVKNLLLTYLGPMGIVVFNDIKKQGLTYDTTAKQLNIIKKEGILTADDYQKIITQLRSIFDIKKGINVSQQIKELYAITLGPMGIVQFESLKKVNASTVVNDINQFEKVGIITHSQASRFRDQVIRIFQHKSMRVSPMVA